jgi:hypothetical protein
MARSWQRRLRAVAAAVVPPVSPEPLAAASRDSGAEPVGLSEEQLRIFHEDGVSHFLAP